MEGGATQQQLTRHSLRKSEDSWDDFRTVDSRVIFDRPMFQHFQPVRAYALLSASERIQWIRPGSVDPLLAGRAGAKAAFGFEILFR
jgi:hypothetical protein